MYNFPAENKKNEKKNIIWILSPRKFALVPRCFEPCACPLCQHVTGAECRATTSVAEEKHNLGRVSELRKFALVLLFSPVAATPVASPAGQHLFTHHTRWASTKVITHGSHGVIASMV